MSRRAVAAFAVSMFATGSGEVKPLDGFVYIGVIARESWLKKNPDLTVRFLRAQQQSFNLIHDPATTNKSRDAVWNKYHPKTDKALFDQHREELPVDLILFVAESHVAAGGVLHRGHLRQRLHAGGAYLYPRPR